MKRYLVTLSTILVLGTFLFGCSSTDTKSRDLVKSGKQYGQRIWNQEYGLTLVIKELIKKENEQTLQNKSFTQGMVQGYLQGARKNDKDVTRSKSKKTVTSVLNAATLSQAYENGRKIGDKLIRNEIPISAVVNRKKQTKLKSKANQLAWRTGFIVGYATKEDGTFNNELLSSAVTLYQGLGE